MNTTFKTWAAATVAFWWLAPNKTTAQQDSLKTTALDAVVVTATKTPKSLSETGKVLTIIDARQLQQSAGKDLAQVLNEQAGLFINGANSNPGKDKSVYLRGARSEYTVILLDGIPLADPSAIGGGAYDLRLIALAQVERIEILSGNQSTLYGSNAIAGVINIITKKEGAKPIGASATVSYGSFNSWKGAVQVAGGNSKIGYVLGATRFSTDGLSEAKEKRGATAEKDDLKQLAYNASFTVKPTKNLQIEPYFRVSDFDGGYDGGGFQDNKKNRYTAAFRNAGISAKANVGRVSLHGWYGYDYTNRTFLDSAYGFTSTDRFKGRFQHAETFAQMRLTPKLDLLVGLNHQQWGVLDKNATEKDPSIKLSGAYSSLMLTKWHGLSAEVGARYNRHSKFGNYGTFSVNPSWLYKNSLKVFVNLASGFKAPSLSQLYGQFGANPELKPETSFNVEEGVQVFLKNKVDLRAVVFQRTIEQLIFYGPQGYENRDQQHDKGFDFEANWRISSRAQVRAFYSYVTGALRKANETTKNLHRIPKHAFGAYGQISFTPNWLVSVSYKYTGKRTDLYFNPDTFVNETVQLNAYHLVDVYTEYSFLKGKLKCFADAKNLLNQNYFEVYGYTALPTNVQIGLNARL